MLSGQNSDYSTYHALKKFVEDGNCNFETIENTPADEMWRDMIPNVRHNMAKVNYLKKAVRMMKERFGGSIPSTFKELKMLSGVGTKMAHTYLQLIEKRVEGISANTHVHRLAARLDWCR
jgi:endonuclease-3